MKTKLIHNNQSVLESTGNTKYVPEVSTRLYKTSISAIKEMMVLEAQDREKGNSVISLGVGTPFYPAPSHIHHHVRKVMKAKKDIDKYTYFVGLSKLRQVISNQSAKNLNIGVKKEEILITAGSMGALFYSMLAIINKGDEVIIPSPYFPSHAHQISIAQGKVIPVPMIADKNTVYQLDIERIKKSINKRTKAIIINSPHNPTGAVFSKENLKDLASVLKNKDIYLITDEVYDYLVYDDLPYYNIAAISSLWPKIIRCCSLSKKYGLMGWRVGYLHTNYDLMMHILKIHDSAIVCAPHISQEAAIAALCGPQNVVDRHVDLLTQNRQLILNQLEKLSDLFEYTKPKGTYYIFPKYKLFRSSIEMAKRLLFEAHVVTVPGIGFGKEGEYHLRLSFGASPEDINTAFYRINKWWKNKGHKLRNKK